MASKASKIFHLVDWHDLPAWQKDNEYILSGYRRVQNRWRGCFHSVWAYFHNETVNIHTHLWGALLFIYLTAGLHSTYIARYETTTWKDALVVSVFLLSAIYCLGASAFYHTVTCHSEKVAAQCHALDYSGIVILIVGSFYPSLYYGFFCNVPMQFFYISGITLAGLGAAYVVLNPEYRKPAHRGARTAVFIGLGLFALFPISHWAIIHGGVTLLVDMGYMWLVLSGLCYIVGALIYANRIPERFAPGKFDYFFASHQIFHCCVVAAALLHFVGVIQSMNYTHSLSGSCDV
ncbi:HlyIII-domain-containing protein [Fistulina hepatica ATCC 64428]|uniref:HlyIII-domain-containing protein n=1 Tax=Fistulina hepatica ATCC 64428 TaxID=1128425 RepID=A0A0D7A9C8_9AGAR|nr:HlyIII-domain-containing protein [Fistulina hepatica ATCC 64428]